MSSNLQVNNNNTPQEPNSPFTEAPIKANGKEPKYTIYIVDDSPMMRRLMKRTFEPFSEYQLSYFANGEDTVAALDTPPDMMVLDFHLSPDMLDTTIMNGLDVLEKVKEVSPETKVVMLSSQNDVSVAVNCLKHGASDYVVKDEVMTVNVTKGIEKIVKSLELKNEIKSLSQTIKRDKLMIKGYFIFTVSLICMVLFLLLR